MSTRTTHRTAVCICAWCRAVIAVVEFSWTVGEGATPHGLCDRCLRRLEERSVPEHRHIADLRF